MAEDDLLNVRASGWERGKFKTPKEVIGRVEKEKKKKNTTLMSRGRRWDVLETIEGTVIIISTKLRLP